MAEENKLSASLEDYLEAIYHIVEENNVARGKNIATRLGVTRASVTEALRALSKAGLVNYAPYKKITMTDKGEEAARDVIFRHEALHRFFVEVLAVDEKVADEGACRIEHVVPREIIERMMKFIDFVETCPRGGGEFLQGFIDYCRKGGVAADCDQCVSLCFDKKRK